MSMAPIDKDTVIDIIAASVSFIPFYGDYIGNGITVAKGFRKLFKDASKANQIIEAISKGIYCNDLSEDDAKSVYAAIQGVLRDKETDLQKIATDDKLIQNLKDDIFKASDHRKDAEYQYRQYISDAVNCILSPDILPLFVNCDQITVQNLHDIRALLEACHLNSERLDHLETRMTDIEQNKSAPKKQSKPDNQEYLNRIYEPLFLEEDDSKVTLASMYVSPHISGKQDTAADCIMTWFGKNSINKCMLLFGSAGVGKSTLISKIIADACCAINDWEYHLRRDQVLAVALRNHCGNIDMNKNASEILMDLFGGYTEEELCDKLLILDGLDEICVLMHDHDFDGHTFLEKMAQLGTGFHVLVTSREAKDYFTDPSGIRGIQIEHLKWEKNELIAWCNKYALAKEEKKKWSERFIREYKDMLDKNADDSRIDIFCVPIILYICGNSGIFLSDHNSVGSIYDDAFRKILLRKYSDTQKGQVELATADAASNLIAWQYTKELAYQMFLLNTLDLAESDDQDQPLTMGLKNARSRTKAFLKAKYGLAVNDDSLEPKKELALCPFAKPNSTGGITFAHKTVYEYFTAVKLYEDYFAQFDSNFFQKKKPQTQAAAKAVAESYIEAFRYKGIPKEIFAYLNSMQKPPFSGSDKVSAGGLDVEHFLQAYVYGMKTDVLSEITVKKPISEYNYQSDPVSMQFNRAFQNFTWFLTGHGFKNADNLKECKNIRDLLTIADTEVCLAEWNLSGAHLRRANLGIANMINANLRDAILSNAYLEDADLTGANLSNADLSNADLSSASLRLAELSNANLSGTNLRSAHLSSADLRKADLRKADLRKADLREADLRYADLRYADLNGTDLRGTDLRGTDLRGTDLRCARYCKVDLLKTKFPADFNPKEHGMIEVDDNGEPVER